MKIWLATIGEPVPVESAAQERLHRTGTFARFLADRGHEVDWWTSTFDHFHKTHWFQDDHTLRPNPQLTIHMLYGGGYSSNVSWKRIQDHRRIARKFAQVAERQSPPQAIVAALPDIGLSLAAVKYGQRHGIPVIVDVRDLWPTCFLSLAPRPMRWAARVALSPLYNSAHAALRQAAGIFGVSEGYLQWGLDMAQRERRPADGVFPLGYQPPAVDDAEQENAGNSLRSKGVDPSRTICWFVGMFGRTYDLFTVVNAARELHREGVKNVQFVLSGSGDDYDRVVEHARGLDNVVFTGWVDKPQIAFMFQNAKIGLMAYAAGAPQGFPNKLFEYMSAGLPIVSSLPNECAALLKQHECGLSYVPKDSHSLATALRTLIDDPQRGKQMGDNGKKLFKEQFQAEKICDNMANHLENLINTQRTPQ